GEADEHGDADEAADDQFDQADDQRRRAAEHAETGPAAPHQPRDPGGDQRVHRQPDRVLDDPAAAQGPDPSLQTQDADGRSDDVREAVTAGQGHGDVLG